MLISNTERGLSNERIQRSNPERSRSKSSLPDPRNKFEASQKCQLLLRPSTGPVAISMVEMGNGPMSQCHDVTVTCQRDNVTNMITCHVSRRDNSITRQCSIRWWEGDWGGDHYILCICTDSAWPGSRSQSRRMARLGSGSGGRAGPGAASLVSVQPASDPETRTTQHTDNNRDMPESSHHQ